MDCNLAGAEIARGARRTSAMAFAPPLHLLSSTVRNQTEASALVDIDLLALRHEVLHDHLLTCCAHEQALSQAHQAISRNASSDPQLHAAAALLASALATIRGNITQLVAEADEVLHGVAECAGVARRYAEGNETLAAEVAEGGAHALAAQKQRLWLIEESLAYRMNSQLDSLRGRMSERGVG